MKVADVKVSDSIIAKVVLTPGQQRAFDLVATAVTRVAPIVLLEGGTRLGKTAVLQRLSETRGGRFLGMTEVLDAIGKRDNPIEVDGAVRELLAISFLESDLVILDDFDTLMLVTRSSRLIPDLIFWKLSSRRPTPKGWPETRNWCLRSPKPGRRTKALLRAQFV